MPKALLSLQEAPLYAFSLLLALVLGTLVHEAGHGFTAVLCGQQIEHLAVAPGIQVYPSIEIVPWEGWIAIIYHSVPSTAFEAGLCRFMGTGATTLLAYLVLLALTFVAGRMRVVLSIIATVFAWDIFMYATMPLVGLRHAVLIGGSSPEPLEAIQLMGIESWLFFAVLSIDFVAFHVILIWSWRRISAARTA